ncbi:MAG: hypothetical protein ACRDRH_15730 [Pseudonocardia sp.]
MSTDVLLRYLSACREASVPGRQRPGLNVVSLRGQRLDWYAPVAINHRLAAISGLFAFAVMRDPALTNPVPKGREARWASAGERNGLLAHVADPSPVRCCGCANHAGCPAGWTGARPPTCWPACGRGGTGRSPG